MARKAKAKKSGKTAALDVLRGSRKPLPVKEVVAAALADPEVTGMKGKTPAATLSAALYTEAKKPDGVFVKTGKGEFDLRERQAAPARRRRRAKEGL